MGLITKKFAAVACTVSIGCSSIFYSCTHQPFVLPENQRTGAPDICFERDILPIFISNCARSGCHNADSHREGYTLDSYDNIVKKGIVAGNPAASIIWQSIYIHPSGVETMPPDGHDLSPGDLDLIKRWIVYGAVNGGTACSISSCDTNLFTYSGAIAPMMRKYCTGCHGSVSTSAGSLEDYASVREAAVNGRMIGDVSHATGYNPMPQGGTRLSDCQITQIKKWVAAGAPNN